MNEKYKPFLKSDVVSIYQKGEKTLIVGKKEITFQTNEKIKKRERKLDRSSEVSGKSQTSPPDVV